MFSCESCWIFKITCFEEHLRPDASIRCYFDTISLKQSGFCLTYSFKIFVSVGKCKTNLKNREAQKKKKRNSHHVYKIYVMFYYEIPCFPNISKTKICFLNLYSVRAAKIQDLPLEIMLNPPKWRTKHLCN